MEDVSYLSDLEICKLLAQRIKKERIAQNMTQEEFAKKSETSKNTYRKFEQNGVASLIKLVAFLKALNKVEILQEFCDFDKERREADVQEYLDTLKQRERKVVRKSKGLL